MSTPDTPMEHAVEERLIAEKLPTPEIRGDRIIYPDPSLVLVTGPSGSGKTLFADRVGHNLELSSDQVRVMLWGSDHERKERDTVFAALHEIIAQRLGDFQESAVVDIVGLKPESRKEIYEIAQEIGVPYHLILLDATDNELRETDQLGKRGLPPEWLDDMLAEKATVLDQIESGAIREEGFSTALVLNRQEANAINGLSFE
jgi:predicted kinase